MVLLALSLAGIAQDAAAQTTHTVTVTGGDGVTEGERIRFQFQIVPPVPVNSILCVAVTVTEDTAAGQDFLATSQAGRKVFSFSGGGGVSEVYVQTVKDRADEPDGAVTVAIEVSEPGNCREIYSESDLRSITILPYAIGTPSSAKVAVSNLPVPDTTRYGATLTLPVGQAWEDETTGTDGRRFTRPEPVHVQPLTLSLRPVPTRDVPLQLNVLPATTASVLTDFTVTVGGRTLIGVFPSDREEAITYPANAASMTLGLRVVRDRVPEEDERVEIGVSGDRLRAGGAIASFVIKNDDCVQDCADFSIRGMNTGTVLKEGGKLKLRFATLPPGHTWDRDVVVSWSTSGAFELSGSVTFTKDEDTAKEVTINLPHDGVDRTPLTDLKITVSTDHPEHMGRTLTSTLHVVDDDKTEVVVRFIKATSTTSTADFNDRSNVAVEGSDPTKADSDAPHFWIHLGRDLAEGEVVRIKFKPRGCSFGDDCALSLGLDASSQQMSIEGGNIVVLTGPLPGGHGVRRDVRFFALEDDDRRSETVNLKLSARSLGMDGGVDLRVENDGRLGGNTLGPFVLADNDRNKLKTATVQFTRPNFEVNEDSGPAGPVLTFNDCPSFDDPQFDPECAPSLLNRTVWIPVIYKPGGTATRGTDCTGATDYHTAKPPLGAEFRAGTVSSTFGITTCWGEGTDSTAWEGDETFIIAIDETLLPEGVTAGAIKEATVTLKDSSRDVRPPDPAAPPVVSIAAGSAVTEGGNATFTLTATPAPASPLPVSVTVAQSGDYAASGATGTKTVTIPTTGSATHTVATVDDAAVEPDGSVTVTLAAGQGYTVHGSDNSASVSVSDNDGPPTVSLVGLFIDGKNCVTERCDDFTPSVSSADLKFRMSRPVSPNPLHRQRAILGINYTCFADHVSNEHGSTAVILYESINGVMEYTQNLELTKWRLSGDRPDNKVRCFVSEDSGPGFQTEDERLPPDYVPHPTEGAFSVTLYNTVPTPLTLTPPANGEIAEGARKGLFLHLGRALIEGETAEIPLVLSGEHLVAGELRVTSPQGNVRIKGGDTLRPSVVIEGQAEASRTDLRDNKICPGPKPAAALKWSNRTACVVVEALDDADPAEHVTSQGSTTHRSEAFTLDVSDDVRFGETNLSPGLSFAQFEEWSGTIEPPAGGADLSAYSVRLVGAGTFAEGNTGHTDHALTVNLYRAAPAEGIAYALCHQPRTVPGFANIEDEDATALFTGIARLRYSEFMSAGADFAIMRENRAGRKRYVDFDHHFGPQCRTFTIAGGRSFQTFHIRVFGDVHDEGDETFRLYLEPRTRFTAAGVAVEVDPTVRTFTISNSDPMPGAWLARFGRTVASQALDAITGRMKAARTPGAEGAIAGQTLSFDSAAGGGTGAAPADRDAALAMAEVAQGFGDNDEFGNDSPSGWSRTMTAHEALRGSSFSLTGQRDGAGGSTAFWGRAARAHFDGREGSFSLDGEATTAMLGADYARGNWLVGLALMRSSGKGGYADTDGKVDASLTAAIPWAALQVSERLKLWGAAGYGSGEVTLKPAVGGSYGADTGWSMAAAGLRGDLMPPPEEGSGPALAVTSDMLWARMSSEKTRELVASESDVARLRFGLEGNYRVATEGGGHVTPKLEVGARHDGGDAETGFGVDLGGGIAWVSTRTGLTLDLSGRTLIAHGNDDLKDRGFAASLAFDPDPDTKRGLSLGLRQDLGGQARGGINALFAPDPLEYRSGSEATSRWTAEAAYGFPAFGGRFTGSPHAGLGFAPGARDWRVGWRLTPEAAPAPDVTFGLRATRRESEAAEPEHTVGVEVNAHW